MSKMLCLLLHYNQSLHRKDKVFFFIRVHNVVHTLQRTHSHIAQSLESLFKTIDDSRRLIWRDAEAYIENIDKSKRLSFSASPQYVCIFIVIEQF